MSFVIIWELVVPKKKTQHKKVLLYTITESTFVKSTELYKSHYYHMKTKKKNIYMV